MYDNMLKGFLVMNSFIQGEEVMSGTLRNSIWSMCFSFLK